MGLLAAVLSGFLLAPLAPALHRFVGSRMSGWILALLPLGITGYLAAQLPHVRGGGVVSASVSWAPALGLDLSLRLDGLGLLFALAVSGVGAVILVYAGGYMAEEKRAGGFLGLMLLFMASMLGVVLADNLLALFVFWELTSVSSFLLIGFEHEREEARSAAWKALMVTALGGQALLAGFLLLGLAGGTLEVSALTEGAESLQGHVLYEPALLLILLGAFTKSAQMPFHFWLPSAMEAPTPVSAYLHSAAMVKAGVYLVARLSPMLGGTPLWEILLTAVGAATLLIGAVEAVRHEELKKVLAYATISALGAMMLLLGLGTAAALEAALLYVLVHVLYKAPLFMVAGGIHHGAGAEEITQVRGLGRAMPFTAAAAALAALSMAGLPPLLGSAGKEGIYEALLHAPLARPVLLGGATLALALLVAVAGLTGARPFLGSEPSAPQPPREVSPMLWLPPLLLALLAAVLGLAPGLAHGLLDPAVTAIGGEPGSIPLAPLPEWGSALALSAASIGAGVLVFLGWSRVRPALWGLGPERWGPDRWYRLGKAALTRFAHLQTRVLQHGHLHLYILVVVAATVCTAGYALLTRVGLVQPLLGPPVRFYDAAVALLILAAAAAAVRAPSFIRMVIALAVVGFGEALIYILFGAPDLAMAQILVQTLTAVIFVLLLTRMPPGAEPLATPTGGRLRDGAVALAAGGVMAALVLVAAGTRLFEPISDFYVVRSVPEAGGRNVVNMILVDFRAGDTVGELTVLSIAALGAATLLGWGEVGRWQRVRSIILTTAVRLLSPLLVLFSIFLLLRGENEPGGGFSGGLVAAVGFVLYAFAFGPRLAGRLIRIRPPRLIAIGLLMAVGSGLPAVFRGQPFLTAQSLPESFGLLAVGTPLLFELAVYLIVLGAALSIVLSLAREGP